jgi:hypothetical protein
MAGLELLIAGIEGSLAFRWLWLFPFPSVVRLVDEKSTTAHATRPGNFRRSSPSDWPVQIDEQTKTEANAAAPEEPAIALKQTGMM